MNDIGAKMTDAGQRIRLSRDQALSIIDKVICKKNTQNTGQWVYRVDFSEGNAQYDEFVYNQGRRKFVICAYWIKKHVDTRWNGFFERIRIK